MSRETPTKSRLIALQAERRAMREGQAFLDEKCLILAAEMLRELHRYEALAERFQTCRRAAATALRAALRRHGHLGLAVYPALHRGLRFEQVAGGLLGIPLWRDGVLYAEPTDATPVYPSPEGEAARQAYFRLAQSAAALAPSVGNLARLLREYRRSARRAGSLHDVVLPELEAETAAIAAQLDEQERDEALWVRRARSETI